MRPNFETCQECPHWDDVNGCWLGEVDIAECMLIDEEGNYRDEDEDSSEEDW